MIVAQNLFSLNGSYQIETSCQIIGLTVSSDISSSFLTSGTIELVYSTRSGTRTVIPRTPISVLLSAGSFNGGVQLIDTNGGFDASRLYFYISNTGYFPLSDGDYLQLTIGGSSTSENPTNSIYAVEVPLAGRDYVFVEPYFIQQGMTKTLDISKNYVIVFNPLDVSLFQITFPERSIVYTFNEILYINMEVLKVTSIHDGGFGMPVSGPATLAGIFPTPVNTGYIMPFVTGDAITCQITALKDTTIWKFSDVPFSDILKAKVNNQKITNIVDNVKEANLKLNS